MLKAVIDIVERVNEYWWGLPERAVVPKVFERIGEHLKVMTPTLGTCVRA
ncbi:hypothetical protein [Ensifer sp. 4252]